MPQQVRDAQQQVDDFVAQATAMISAAIDYAGADEGNPIASANIRKLTTVCNALLAALQAASTPRQPPLQSS